MSTLPSRQAMKGYIRRAIQSDKKFPRKPKPGVKPNLHHGWLLPLLLETDDYVNGRWEYWGRCMETGRLPDAPIPAMDWSEGDSLHNPARKMLEASLNAVPRYGEWQGWSSWRYFDYFLDWLLYGLGHQGQPELPAEPPDCEGASSRLYQVFTLEAMLVWPHDYFGDILAENKHGRGQGFFPTPMKLRQRRLPDGRIVDLWAISQSGDCLGKTPDQHGYFTFDFEPLPSSRDELHYQEYRFDSAEEAYQFWLDNRPKILATQDEWLEFVRVIRGV